jgi:hypothetical protein
MLGFGSMGREKLLPIVGLVACAFAACEGNGNPEIPAPAPGGTGSQSSGGTGQGGSGGDEDGSAGGGGDSGAPDAPIAPVLLGVLPAPREDTTASRAEALLDSAAMGSRALTLELRWDALFSGPTTPVNDEWTRLANTASFQASIGRRLLVCLSLVELTESARPAGLNGTWDATATQLALDALIDKTYATFGSELYLLSFGNELDRYLKSVEAAERGELVALVQHGIEYAKSHPQRPAESLVGVTFAASVASDPLPPSVSGLMNASDALVFSYQAVSDAYAADTPGSVAGSLDALAAIGQSDAGMGKPVVLQRVAYPSAVENESSSEQQEAFYRAFFEALVTRRARHPFVVIDGLYDDDDDDCVALATFADAAGNPKAEAMYCSFGLRDASGSPKPAFSTVIDGLATFSSP